MKWLAALCALLLLADVIYAEERESTASRIAASRAKVSRERVSSADLTEQRWIDRVRAQTSEFFQFEGIKVENGKRVWSYRLSIVETEHVLGDGAADAGRRNGTSTGNGAGGNSVTYKVWAYGGTVPAPTLVVREQDVMRIQVTNETSTEHTIHSHGLFVPQRMDGVPHAHGKQRAETGDAHHHLPRAIPPGESFTYEYIARPAGTHWYHCHVNTNEHLKRGMAGALVVLPKTPDPPTDCDEILLLQEWNSRYARGGQPGDPREQGANDWFTINGLSFPQTRSIYMEPGQLCRLRVINAGSQFHSMHLHGHSFLVTHKDGARIPEPMEMDTVPVGPGERVDLLVLGNNPGEWPLHCHDPTHQTNAGAYPGGMMTHLFVGSDPSPASGNGPIGGSMEEVREWWKRGDRARPLTITTR